MSENQSEAVIKMTKPNVVSKRRWRLFKKLKLRPVRTTIRPDGIPVLEVKRDD